MPRGGRRQPTPGRSYSNRTDLQLATGQPYGQEKKLADAVAAVPAQGAPTPQAPPGHDEALAAMAGFTPSTAPTPLTVPSQRPGEPVMTPPPATVQRAPSPVAQAVGLLNSLGANVSPQVAALRKAATVASMNEAAQ